MRVVRGSSLLTILAMVALLLGGPAGIARAAVDNVLVGASGMKGISLDTWATGDLQESIAEDQGLRLSRLHFDACTGIVLHNTGGSVLIYVESGSIAYAIQGGESTPDTPLAQGESLMLGPVDFAIIVNPTADNAFAADLLVLSVVEGDSFVDVPVQDRLSFGKDSQCDEVNENGTVTPTILAEGLAGLGGTTLYIGSAFFYPDATTEGWGVPDEGDTFNLLLLGGGMGTAGPNSGRAVQYGPGDVLHDYYNEGPIESFPFVNSGPSPVFGLVFGTVEEDSAVFSPGF